MCDSYSESFHSLINIKNAFKTSPTAHLKTWMNSGERKAPLPFSLDTIQQNLIFASSTGKHHMASQGRGSERDMSEALTSYETIVRVVWYKINNNKVLSHSWVCVAVLRSGSGWSTTQQIKRGVGVGVEVALAPGQPQTIHMRDPVNHIRAKELNTPR